MKPSLLTKLSKLIEGNPAYIVEGKLNKNLLAADARKYDSNLLNTLQKDKEIKEHFFTETDGGLVFRKDVFLQFISNKQFLPDSFTKYKIKIGLGNDYGSLLAENGDVVLNWPYKDAILEGGQDKEDQKRSEVFFNEVLAPDQITRLLDDKVFTNWKRFDKDGEHELDELKDNDNLIIKGNNLVVLHSLKKRFAGKVKLIYIDPPYNTGSDSFGYNDRFNHSTWLTFMKNRLEIAKELLSPDGSIFIQVDGNENGYLKVLLDEIFGRDNFRSQITWLRSSSGKTISRNLSEDTDYILWYSKSMSYTFNPVYKPLSEATRKMYSKDDGDGRGVYRLYPLQKTGSPGPETTYDFTDNEGKIWSCPAKGWRMKQEKLKALENDGRLHKQGRSLSEKAYWNERTGDGQIANNLWDDIFNLQGSNLEKIDFVGQKPEKLIKRIIDMVTSEGDLVLDYHLGSGTTAATAMKAGRQFIGVEQLFYGENDPTERIKRVIKGDISGISKEVNWQGGGSFVYANIMNNANTFHERVEKAKNDADYITLLNEATSSSFLSYRVDPSKLNEDEFHRLSSAEKRQLLLELIDNNTLYVNYEDINDPIFKVSDSDKKFNKELYKKSDD